MTEEEMRSAFEQEVDRAEGIYRRTLREYEANLKQFGMKHAIEALGARMVRLEVRKTLWNEALTVLGKGDAAELRAWVERKRERLLSDYNGVNDSLPFVQAMRTVTHEAEVDILRGVQDYLKAVEFTQRQVAAKQADEAEHLRGLLCGVRGKLMEWEAFFSKNGWSDKAREIAQVEASILPYCNAEAPTTREGA